MNAIPVGPQSANEGSPAALDANPSLTHEQLVRLRAFGTPDDLSLGETAFDVGDPTYDLIVIERGAIEILRPATPNAPVARIITYGPGTFVGELGLLTEQHAYLTARVVESAHIYRISPRHCAVSWLKMANSQTYCSELFLHAGADSLQDPRPRLCRSSEVRWTQPR